VRKRAGEEIKRVESKTKSDYIPLEVEIERSRELDRRKDKKLPREVRRIEEYSKGYREHLDRKKRLKVRPKNIKRKYSQIRKKRII